MIKVKHPRNLSSRSVSLRKNIGKNEWKIAFVIVMKHKTVFFYLVSASLTAISEVFSLGTSFVL